MVEVKLSSACRSPLGVIQLPIEALLTNDLNAPALMSVGSLLAERSDDLLTDCRLAQHSSMLQHQQTSYYTYQHCCYCYCHYHTIIVMTTKKFKTLNKHTTFQNSMWSLWRNPLLKWMNEWSSLLHHHHHVRLFTVVKMQLVHVKRLK